MCAKKITSPSPPAISEPLTSDTFSHREGDAMSDNPTTSHRPGDDPPGIRATRTTMYDKLSPDLRCVIDQAVVDRDPPTFRGIYEKFRLADAGLSYYAFYRYARKLRSQADKLHLSELVMPDDADLGEAVPRLIAQQLLDMLFSEESPSPEQILRLTRAYRIANEACYARRRYAARFEDEQRKARTRESDDLCRAANQIVRAQANDDFIKARVAKEAKAAFEDLESRINPPVQAIRTRAEARRIDANPPAHPCTGLRDSSFHRVRSDPTQYSALSTQDSELSPGLPGPAPPSPRSRSPTSLSQRRRENRRDRRRQRLRRARS
jgi:hypothetical protein